MSRQEEWFMHKTGLLYGIPVLQGPFSYSRCIIQQSKDCKRGMSPLSLSYIEAANFPIFRIVLLTSYLGSIEKICGVTSGRSIVVGQKESLVSQKQVLFHTNQASYF